MHLLSTVELRELFNSGRFRKEPTVFFGTLEYNEGCPVEFSVVDRQMKELGTVWEGDIQAVIDSAEQDSYDSARLNPNVAVFHAALKQMQEFKADIKIAEEAERKFHAEKVVSLFPAP